MEKTSSESISLHLEQNKKSKHFNFLVLTSSISQILPVSIKSLAGSVATLANWFSASVVTMTANLLLTWSSGGSVSLSLCLYLYIYTHKVCLSIEFWYNLTGTFVIYASVSAFTVAFVALWVPETKGKTLEEIQGFFR